MFLDINKQIGELTSLVKTLTEKLSSNPREGNGLNNPFTTDEARSDSDKIIPQVVRSGISIHDLIMIHGTSCHQPRHGCRMVIHGIS